MSVEMLETVPASDDAPARRFRGKNKGVRWNRGEDTELAVIRLPLDVHDLASVHRVEQLFSSMWSVKRALQRDARVPRSRRATGPDRARGISRRQTTDGLIYLP